MEKRFGIIYKATNKDNGKSYIGQTIKTMPSRKADHLSNARCGYYNSYFHKGIRKYGEDSFSWEVICECYSRKELDDAEMYYIKEYNTLAPNGYNLAIGGGGANGYIHTEEGKKRMSESRKGRVVTEETRKKLSEAHKGKKKSKEARKKMSEYWKGRKQSPELVAKRVEKLKGHIVTEEARKKISEGNKGKPGSFKGKKHTEESKKKMSEAAKKRVITQETREKMYKNRRKHTSER